MSQPIPVKKRRHGTRMTIRAIVLVAVVGIRGFVIGYLAEGVYRLSSFALDAVAVVSLFLILSCLELGLEYCLRKIISAERIAGRVLIHAIRLAILFTVFVPFLIVTLTLHPQRIACQETPDKLGLSYENVTLWSDGTSLDGWYIPSKNKTGPVVFVAHGIGANKQAFLLPVADLHAMGFPILTVDLRAHGDSGGFWSTLGMKEADDVKSAYDWLKAKHPGRPIFAVGYSMGGAAVSRAAGKYGIFDRIVLDSSFASLHGVAEHHYLRYFGPLRELAWREGCFWGQVWVGADFNEDSPESYAAVLSNKPILLIHGKSDRVVPCAESVRLHEKLGNMSEMWLVEDTNHIETILDPAYAARIKQFFEVPGTLADTAER